MEFHKFVVFTNNSKEELEVYLVQILCNMILESVAEMLFVVVLIEIWREIVPARSFISIT